MHSNPVTFRCPDDLLKQLDKEASADHRARSSLIVKILSAYYAAKPTKKAGK